MGENKTVTYAFTRKYLFLLGTMSDEKPRCQHNVFSETTLL